MDSEVVKAVRIVIGYIKKHYVFILFLVLILCCNISYAFSSDVSEIPPEVLPESSEDVDEREIFVVTSREEVPMKSLDEDIQIALLETVEMVEDATDIALENPHEVSIRSTNDVTVYDIDSSYKLATSGNNTTTLVSDRNSLERFVFAPSGYVPVLLNYRDSEKCIFEQVNGASEWRFTIPSVDSDLTLKFSSKKSATGRDPRKVVEVMDMIETTQRFAELEN